MGCNWMRSQTTAAVLANRQLWEKVLRKVRAGVMPPSGESRPNKQEVQVIAGWTNLAVPDQSQ